MAEASTLIRVILREKERLLKTHQIEEHNS
jgi:hypothetical protein